jgi:hypothetical protein
MFGEPTFADAILDRIVHNAYRLDLDGPSMRKLIANQQSQSDARAAVKDGARSASATDPKSAKEPRGDHRA